MRGIPDYVRDTFLGLFVSVALLLVLHTSINIVYALLIAGFVTALATQVAVLVLLAVRPSVFGA